MSEREDSLGDLAYFRATQIVRQSAGFYVGSDRSWRDLVQRFQKSMSRLVLSDLQGLEWHQDQPIGAIPYYGEITDILSGWKCDAIDRRDVL